MGNPENFDNEIYTPGVTADWRAQMTLGMNAQYNSWMFGLTGRVIYDKNPVGPISDGFVFAIQCFFDIYDVGYGCVAVVCG